MNVVIYTRSVTLDIKYLYYNLYSERINLDGELKNNNIAVDRDGLHFVQCQLRHLYISTVSSIS